MADLKTVLTDIASAIKYKLEDDTPIAPVDFADQISLIPVEGGGYSDPTPIINGTVRTVSNSASFIRAYAFYGCDKLTTANFPECLDVRDGVFQSCTNLKAVHLESCESIGNSAFQNCIKLSQISFPECKYIGSYAFMSTTFSSCSFSHCEYVGNNAFHDCFNISSVYLPECSYIGEMAFFNCSSLTEIEASKCLWAGSNAFNACDNLTSVYLPECEYLGAKAFADCYSLNNINLQKVKSIKGLTFKWCSSLLSISLPECSEISNDGLDGYGVNIYSGPFNPAIQEIYAPKCMSIGYGAFIECSNLTSLVIDYSNVDTISNGAFLGTNLSYLSFPTAYSVGSWGFSRCSNLTEIYIPNLRNIEQSGFAACQKLIKLADHNFLPKLECIGSSAFEYCTSLPNLILKNCSRISNAAFNGCQNLSELTILSTSCSIAQNNALANTPMTNSTYLGYYGSIYVLPDYVNTFKTAWGTFSDRITSITDTSKYIFPNEFQSSTLTEIPSEKSNALIVLSWAFNSCLNLSSVNLSECTYLDFNAFTKCTNLSDVSLPKCTYVDATAFTNCNNITNLYIPNLYSIPANFLKSFNYLQSYNFENTTYIGSNVFSNRSIVTEASYPCCSVIGSSAFYNCSNLSQAYFPNCYYIYDKAFANCTNLTNFITGGRLYTVSNSAFAGCTNLQSIDLCDTRSVGMEAFINCSSLSRVSFGKNLYDIQTSAFKNCSNLNSIYIPLSLSNGLRIWNDAFNGCSALSEIQLPNNLTDVMAGAFDNCPNLIFNEASDGYYLGNSSNSFKCIYSLKSSITSYKMLFDGSLVYAHGCLKPASNLSQLTIGGSLTNNYNQKRIRDYFGLGGYDNMNTDLSITLESNVDVITSSCFAGFWRDVPSLSIQYGLTNINLPSSISRIYDRAFYNCQKLELDINSPNIQDIGDYAFCDCKKITSLRIPNCRTIGDFAFSGCLSLSSVLLGSAADQIRDYAFQTCTALSKLYLLKSSGVVQAMGPSPLNNTPMTNSTYLGYYGSIYVPASLVSSYQSATRWSAYSERFVGLTDSEIEELLAE